MTNIEYIRQLPGREKFKPKENCVGEVGSMVGLEMKGRCDGKCDECANDEATINGEPAPFIFSCPLEPGMTVYRILCEYGTNNLFVQKREIGSVEFLSARRWIANFCDIGNFHWREWLVNVFPTREEAEKELSRRNETTDKDRG